MKKEYQVLARRYRPQLFCEVVGQEAIVTTLKNAIRMDRIAHAYLFCGSQGTGKTSLARLFAKILNCKTPTLAIEPCNSCSSCKEISSGYGIDVLEIDGASHRGIEDVRQIKETIGFMPATGRYKIYLIDEVHMLTKEAFNALLKILEEPPPHVKFLFATTEPHKLPSTILSRCQRFNLGRIPHEKIVDKLALIATELAISIEKEALFSIADLAEGSLRDAESLFDQVIAYQEGAITAMNVADLLGLASQEVFFALDVAVSKRELTAAFSLAKQIFSSGKNITYFLEELIAHFRTLFLFKSGISPKSAEAPRYLQSASYYRVDQILQILDLIIETQQTLKMALMQQTVLEMLLLRILRTSQQISLEQLVERLLLLEKQSFDSEKSVPPPPTKQPSPPPIKEAPKIDLPVEEKPRLTKIQEQSLFDTLMRFAAKELNGSLKKE